MERVLQKAVFVESIGFNDVREFEGEKLRVWARAQDGHYCIWSDGLMRWFHDSEIANMKAVDGAGAFPAQDSIENM